MANSSNSNKKKTTSQNSTRRTTASGSKSNSSRNSNSRSNSSRTNSTRTNSSRYERAQVEPLDKSLQNEILLIVLMAVCIFLFLCNFKVLGAVGSFFSGVMFGLFGMIAYILPIGVIIFALFRIFNRDNPIVTRKLVSSSVLALLVMVIFELATGLVNPQIGPFSVKDVYDRCSSEKKGGGVIGGFFAYFDVKLLGKAGTWILIIVLVCICVIIITGKSLLTGIKEQGQILYDDSRERGRYAKEQSARRRDKKRLEYEEKIARKKEINDELERERRLKREERENEQILRMEKKAKGVSYDTTLSNRDGDDDSETVNKSINDSHEINLTSEDVYEEKLNNSAVLHNENVSEASDATREITFDYEDDYMEPDTYETVSDNNYSSVVEDVHVYAEPEPTPASTIERVNTMERSGNRTRPTAALKKEEETPKKKIPGTGIYKLPPVDLLTKGKGSNTSNGERELKETAEKLQQTLEVFGVKVKITDISRGPAVTRYEMQPELGVKVSKIVGLADDLKLSLAATDIRIEAPIPGKSAVGIEVPNKENEAVAFRDMIESSEFKSSTAALPFAVGKDIAGKYIVHDIAKMPHVLIAGATGSGKSVCINTIIMSILYKCKPDDVKLIMIDPKVVELSVYNGIPHLLLPVVTDPKKAAGALGWAVKEMTDRYAKFADTGVRDIKGYNAQISDPSEKMPHILIIVDELADLMMVAPGEVEEYICRLAQLARACGIHLVIATQRPSVDVITGLIKANMPSRVAFAVSSGVDSRTILDMVGAEKLLGKGDMLFYPQGLPKPSRVQGAFVPDSDVSKVVSYLKNLEYVPSNEQDIDEQVNSVTASQNNSSASSQGDGGLDLDPFFAEAGRFIIGKEKASIGALQRLLKIGFNRAARIMDQLAGEGVVGEEAGTKPREILMDESQFEELLQSLGLE